MAEKRGDDRMGVIIGPVSLVIDVSQQMLNRAFCTAPREVGNQIRRAHTPKVARCAQVLPRD